MSKSSQSLSLFREKCSNQLEIPTVDSFDYLSDAASDSVNEERSRARSDQILHLHDLSKNVLYVILTYLKCHELYSLLKSNGKLYKKLTGDPYLQQI